MDQQPRYFLRHALTWDGSHGAFIYLAFVSTSHLIIDLNQAFLCDGDKLSNRAYVSRS